MRADSDLDSIYGWWLDDASYSTAAIEWDRAADVVTIPFESYVHLGVGFPPWRPARTTMLWKSYYVPWFRVTLAVRCVRDVSPEPAQLVEPGMLWGIEWSPETLILRVKSANEEASLELTVDALDAELIVTDEIEHWREHTYGRGLEWDSWGDVLDEPPTGGG